MERVSTVQGYVARQQSLYTTRCILLAPLRILPPPPPPLLMLLPRAAYAHHLIITTIPKLGLDELRALVVP